jgi:DNA repair protein RecN (Recombination protein N)
MLLEIRVRNFAVIDAVATSFGPGLNVLTGETGAGKSMLLDAILLIRGARAQTDVIRRRRPSSKRPGSRPSRGSW